jgi:5-methylcytosine-specific restriction endonuclease McrA
MPIRAENKNRYPRNWPAIAAGIRARAGNACEECVVANRALGGRDHKGRWCAARPTGTDGMRLIWPRPGDWAWCSGTDAAVYLRIVRIVLTVAHLNHLPEDCRPENLRAWCQRCHNRYDAATRARGIRERARRGLAAGDLFG